ncbi:MAG: hypothetical protein AAGH76_17370 [Pseudomonadota bacterium]
MESFFAVVDSGQVTIVGSLLALAIAIVAGGIGGAIGGVIVGGKHMGNELAAMMGSFYGPVAAIPGVLLALVAFLFI